MEGVWEDRPEDIEEDFADNLVVTETGVSVGLGEEELKEVGPKKTIQKEIRSYKYETEN